MRLALAALLLAGCGIRPYAHFTPLIDAARDGNAAAIRDLAAHGADPNEPAGNNNWTPLLHAIHRHQIASVAALLDAGADVNRAGGEPQGLTPLMMAAGYGYSDIVQLLLARGANPRLADASGFHAIDLAVAGVPDIDRFTLFQCQDETVRILRSTAPDIKVDSRVRSWGKVKGCAGWAG